MSITIDPEQLVPAKVRIDTLAALWKSDAAYTAYATAQATKTQLFRTLRLSRVVNLIGLLVREMYPRSPVGLSALAIGCRNTHELDGLHMAGFGPVTGIDLLSMSTQIRAMDMHALDFPDARFDLVFASHSLEHAYDVDVALGEWARVTRPGGYWAIEVPCGFAPTAVDRQVFLGAEDLARRCHEHLHGKTLHASLTTKAPNVAPEGRVIVQKPW